MSRERRLILALFAVALGLRVLFAAAVGTRAEFNPAPVTNDLNYAREIVSGFEWITTPYSPRAPGYPVVLATFLFITAKQLWLALFLQAVLSALTVLIVYKMGEPFLGKTMALLASLWLAISVHPMVYASIFQREVLAVFLLVLLVFLLTRPFQRMRFGLLSGLIYAALFHVDPQYLLIFPLIAVFVLFFKSRFTFLNLQYFFLFVVAALLFTIPWTVRNRIVYGQPIPIALEASKYLRPFKVALTDTDRAIPNIEQRITNASRTRRIENNAAEFWRFARFNDGPALWPDTSTNALEPAWSMRHNLASIFTFGIVMPFFVLGIIFVFRDRQRTGWMLALTTLYYFLMRTYLGGSERARLPVEPFIILIAFYGVLVLVRRFAPSRDESETSV